MHTCPSCQAQMLEYLYDLLDPAERQAVQDHLDACAACRAALEKAREQQNLLAAAARIEFADVHFAAPAEAPAVVPMPAPARRKALPWRRWAAAAAVLLAVGGLAVPGWWAQEKYADAGRIVQKQQARESDARQRMMDALAQRQEVEQGKQKKIEDIRDAAQAAQLKLAVVGSDTAIAGAPATYEVQTTDLNGQPVAAKVTAQVATADRQPVGDPIPVVKASDGEYRLTLPPDLPVKPDSRLTLVVSAKREETGVQAQVRGDFDLAAPVYVTHLDTDKPMYQPGEMVHYRSLTLDRFTFKPAEEALQLTYDLVTPTGVRRTLVQGTDDLRDDTGAAVVGPDKKPIRGVGAGEFILDPNAVGGEYTLICREDANRFPEQSRKFIVNNYPKPQLNKQIDFSRSTYGPGDEVSARCKAVRVADGQPLRNQPVEATVLIDGKKVGDDGKETQQPLRLQTDDQGTVVVRFQLPATIERGEASLGVNFASVPETISRPLPIVLKKLNVEFFPEGGDLAGDLPNRVYFQVRTPLGKPADLKGRLLEDGEPLAVAVETVHDDKEPGVNQGMGRFEFTPKSGKVYALQIDSPVGITAPVALPKVIDDRVALSVPDGVVEAGKPIKVVVHSKTERALMVGLYCRGRLLQSVQLKKGETEAVLNPEAGAGGVCRVTVFEETTGPAGSRERPQGRELKPVAERLIYRRPAEQLTVHLHPDRSSYVPGEKATLQVAAENEKGEPAPAVVMLVVVDKSVLTLADEKTYRSMPTHFLLTSEVRRPEDLEYADFLLGPQDKAKDALDLLLGVQGWRRFAEQDPAKFREKDIDREEAERLLVMSGQSTPRKADLGEEEIKKLRDDAEAREVALKEQFDQASAEADAAGADPVAATAVATRASYDGVLEQVRLIGMPLVGAALLVAALVFLVLGLRKHGRRAVPWYAAAAASVALMVAAVQTYRTGATKLAVGGEAQLAWVDSSHAPEGLDAAPAPADEGAADLDRAAAAGGVGGPLAAQFDRPFGAPAAAMKPGFAPAPGLPPSAPPPPLAAGGFAAARTAATVPAPANRPDEKADANLALRDAFRDQARKGADDRQIVPPEEERAGQMRQLAELQKRADGLALGADGAKQEAKDKDGKDVVERDQLGRRALWQKNMDALNRQRAFGYVKGGNAQLTLAPSLVVREYAHSHDETAGLGTRSDFAETLCWRPVLVLPDGKAEVAFDLSDSVTTFQATAFAHTPDGRLGAAVGLLESRLPFTLQPATPLEVTASDKIDVPVTVSNNTADKRDVQLKLMTHDNLKLLDGKELDEFPMDGGKTARPVYRFQPTAEEGMATLEFAGRADPFAADAVTARFRIVPEGFPVTESRSDLLEGTASHVVDLPDTWVKGTLKCRVHVYPSTLADLQSGLESLLREPNGCFEQTSTTNYPNLLILDYLKESNQTRPEVEARAASCWPAATSG